MAERREAQRARARDGLAAVVWLALADAGKARWDVSWSELASITMADGFDVEYTALLEAAVADTPDVGPLRAVLAQAGVPEGYRI